MLLRGLFGTLIGLLLAIAVAMPASADSPGAGFKQVDDTFASPDGQIRLEQYSQD